MNPPSCFVTLVVVVVLIGTVRNATERKRIEEDGYDIELLKRGKEKNPYFHYSLKLE